MTATTGSFGLAAGTISGGSITATGGASLIPNTNANNQLSGVTIGTGAVLNLSATSTYVRLTNGSTFAAGSTVTVGSSAGLGIAQTQTVDNVAVTLNSNSYLAVEGATSAVLGSGVTVSQAASTGGNLGAGFNFTATGNLTNQGTIQVLNASATTTVNPSGSFTNSGTLKVGGATAAILNIAPGGAGVATGSPTWTNTGSMVVDANGTLNLGGRMTTAGLNLPGISRLNSGGTINITGPLDNTAGGPLALTTATGSFGLAAGTISGGSITATGGASLIPNTNANNQLSGVTIGTGAVLNLSATSTYVRLTNGSTFAAGSTVTVGSSAGLGIAQTQTVDNVAVTLNANSYVAVEGATSVVLGSGVTVSQAASTTGNVGANFDFTGTGNLTNQGTIQVLNASATTTVNPSGSFTNSGTLKVGGATAAILNIAPGGAGVATGSPTWTNTGSMVVDANGTLNLGGRMTTAGLNLPGISRLNSGGTINITGPLDNTAGGPLALTTATGSFGLAAGTISGGSITATGGAALAPNTNSNNQLSGVTIGTGAVLNLSASNTYVRLTNGSTFAAGSTVTVGSSAGLGIAQTQTVDNVAVTLNSNSYLAVEGATSAVLGSGVTVSQTASTTGNVGANFDFTATGNLTNQGLIQANATSATTNINPSGTFSNSGTLLAGNGGTINIPAATGLTNLSGGTLTGGTYVVQGSSTMNFNARTIATIAAGTTVTLDGASSTFVAANTVAANAGTFNLLNGRAFTVSGGTLTNTGSVQVGSAAVLTGNLNTTAGSVSGAGTVTGNVVFAGTGNALQPGSVSPGNLTVAGNLTLTAGTTLTTKLNGTTFGTQHDRLTVTGAANVVSLAGASLSTNLGYDPAVNDRLFIIDNQTNNPISGTFASLPADGSTFQTTNPGTGHTFTATIFYSANTSTSSLSGGNDVVLVFTPVPEPASLLVFGAFGLFAAGRARRILGGKN